VIEFQMEDTPAKGKKRPPSAAAAAARSAMLLLAAVVLVGWLVVWAVYPTRTYSSTWAPKLATLTGFGKQGFIYLLPLATCMHCNVGISSSEVTLFCSSCFYLQRLG
jgi:hypothetical protein